jgi:hypothetical protein
MSQGNEIEENNSSQRNESSLNMVSVDLNKFFEMTQYIHKKSLSDDLMNYLKNNGCDEVIIESKALILFKKFVTKVNPSELPQNFKTSDWCPCVKNAS